MKINRLMIAVLCLGLCVAFSTACNHENMSRVTLYFGFDEQAINVKKKGLLQNIFSIFFEEAYAVTPPSDWTVGYNNVTLTITGDSMDPITATIPSNVSSYTIEVPAGSARLFTIIATTSAGIRKWGGHVLADLDQDDVNLTLRILPIPDAFTYTGGTNIDIAWAAIPGPTSVTGYNLYRSTSDIGPYLKVYSGSSNQTMVPSSTGVTYYFKVSVNTPYGEGEMSNSQRINN